ncbi:hypothetical protein BSK65_10480 [Paenibacillus odorifer]|uniref:Uncharacterized protein n=1 Tax=Paenibacillus odorifer TaxID=189426 RepID=A0A1R0ZJG8_9BACL|nr:hypothetical protein [Paenibacillus odorifer]OME71465.1 hypothetical protein BSK65_10480 [Paenibacillus odorifer]
MNNFRSRIYGVGGFLSERSRAILSVPNLIQHFVNEGWDYVDSKGIVTFLPIGDDDFNWLCETIDRNNILNILKINQAQKETIGIQLLRRDSKAGCDLLIFNTNEMVFSLSIYRNKIVVESDIDITDFTWYLEKILPVFKNPSLQVEQIICEQVV